MKGAVIYEGPSVLDGGPIVCVLVGIDRTSYVNLKTGRVGQTHIMRADVDPVAATRTGEDASVCGACPHRWNARGACYVNVGQGPWQIWHAWKAGRYERVRPRDVDVGKIRAGSYGDPAAVPLRVWEQLRGLWVGYTHQWRRPEVAPFQRWCMASCDTPDEVGEARALGWRTFRVRPLAGPLLGGELGCVYDTHGVRCDRCGLCGGDRTPSARDISIEVHGQHRGRYLRVLEAAS